jgi:hypothetical protein
MESLVRFTTIDGIRFARPPRRLPMLRLSQS